MVGLGQVDQLEVEGEGTGELVDLERIVREEMHGSKGQFELLLRGDGIFFLAPEDAGATEGLYRVEERVAYLLPEHVAQQHAERAHIAAQGDLLQLRGAGLQLGEAIGPVIGGPERGHGIDYA